MSNEIHMYDDSLYVQVNFSLAYLYSQSVSILLIQRNLEHNMHNFSTILVLFHQLRNAR